VVAALGVAFGDIGTSPLYAIQACFSKSYGLKPEVNEVLGLLSLVFWALLLVVSFKYVSLMLLIDSRGEGGICAMLDRIRHERLPKRWRIFAFSVTVLGAALLFGDGVITPAISVLSALEGLSYHSPAAGRLTMPLAAIVLAGLFLIQRYGTGRVGVVFGPIMVVWFIMIGVLGSMSIYQNPQVLTSVNPVYAIAFVQKHAGAAFVVLGAVVLVVTGCEALYADLGHFGRKAIRIAWFTLVFPSLLLCYFGQGAAIIANPEAVSSPFFALVPQALLWPMIILSTMAAVIASQAIISGLFSLTRQASNLGLFPPLKVVHTSSKHKGQIFVPIINVFLMISCILLVVIFHKSDALASAYGIAVTGMMVLTTLMFMVVTRTVLRWPFLLVLVLGMTFLLIDLIFFSANVLKIKDGGWLPLVIAVFFVAIMSTWLRGSMIIGRQHRIRSMSFTSFKRLWGGSDPERVPGVGVFLTTSRIGIPASLAMVYKTFKVLPEKVVLLSIQVEEVPYVGIERNIRVYKMPGDFFHVTVRRGYLDEINVPDIMDRALSQGLDIDRDQITYYVRQLIIDTSENRRMVRWRRRLFQFLLRNQWPAVWAFHLPPNHTMAVGIVVRV
jgi:KUP system potassium uptake protein